MATRPQEIKIHGLAKLQRKLDQLPDKVAKKHMRRAVRNGATLIRDEAKALAPIKTGTLEKSIRVWSKRGDPLTFLVGPSRTAWYAHLVEFGTRHSLSYPFLRPALDAMAKPALRRIRRILQQAIAMEARRP